SGVRPEPSVGETIAVNVIESPWNAGLSDELRAVDVLNRSPGVTVGSVRPPTAGSSVSADPVLVHVTVPCVLYCATGGVFTVTSNTIVTLRPAGSVPIVTSTGGGGGGGLAARSRDTKVFATVPGGLRTQFMTPLSVPTRDVT